MSRIGNKPVLVPNGVNVTIDKNNIAVKGPKGSLSLDVHPLIKIEKDGDSLKVFCAEVSDEARKMHGMSRTLVNNLVEGVSNGFKRDLDIEGVGYRAEIKGQEIHLALGFSHPVVFPLPNGIKASVDAKRTKMSLEGIDKQLLGATAAKLRAIRPPEPYGGKGIRYSDEIIVRKEGKSAGK